MNAVLVLLVGGVLCSGIMGYALIRARKRRRAEFESDADALAITSVDKEVEDSNDAADSKYLEQESNVSETEVSASTEVDFSSHKSDKKIRAGLEKSRGHLLGRLSEIFPRGSSLKEDMLDDLEELLLSADVGVGLAMAFCERIRADMKTNKPTSVDAVEAALREHVVACFKQAQSSDWEVESNPPRVILFVGVNGVGKTTTIGKIAAKLVEQNKNVVLAAGDTFRAAAAEQLEIWSKRTDSTLIRSEAGADPASVIFNALTHAKHNQADYVLADTAGRLHTKTELMDELIKITRVAGKACDGAPHEVWLIVDATMGQNALQQAKEFHGALGLTGVILTKLDGTARGGIVVAIADTLKLPILFVGVGEQADDLRPFVSQDFVDGLLSPEASSDAG